MVRRINLVPADERRRTKTDFGLVGVVVVVLVVLGALAGSYLYFHGRLTVKEQELADVQAQNQQIMTQLAGLSEFDALQRQTAAAEEVVQKIYAGRTLLSEVLGDLSVVVPDNVWFTGLTASASDIPGIQTDPSAPPLAAPTPGALTLAARTYGFEDVARFLVRVEQIPSVSDVKLTGAGEATGAFAPGTEVKEFGMGAMVQNTQAPDTPLPLSQVEVEGP